MIHEFQSYQWGSQRWRSPSQVLSKTYYNDALNPLFTIGHCSETLKEKCIQKTTCRGDRIHLLTFTFYFHLFPRCKASGSRYYKFYQTKLTGTKSFILKYRYQIMRILDKKYPTTSFEWQSWTTLHAYEIK